MASNSITHFLFLSLLLFHSIFLVKCDDGPDDDDNLLQGINQYRSSLSLPRLTHNERLECLADDIADRFNNQPCPTNTSATLPKFSDYPDLLTKCMVNNATLQGAQILPVCLPESQSSQLLPTYTGPRYATYLNDTRFSGIGIGNDDNWTIIILITATSGTSTTPGTPATPTTPGTIDDDDLLQGINQYRSTSRLPLLTHNDRLECLAEDIADRFNNQPCPTNASATLPKFSDYPDLLTKCMVNNATLQGAQILPVCLPESQSSQLLPTYTGPRYATYLNDTRFSGIGIGNDDNWTIIILITATSGTSTTPGTPATPTTPGTIDDDDLLQGINQYRSTSRLPLLTHNDRLECLAEDIADRFNNQPCPTNASATLPKFSDYPDLLTKCMVNNATLQGAQILPVCLPESQSSQLLPTYTGPRYATYLNDTRFSGIGIGNDDNWTIIILITATSGTSTTPGTPATPTTPGTIDDDDLLQGINQYRSTSRLPLLTHNDRLECLAEDIADRFNNQPCPTNASATQPKFSDYPDLLTKCMVNNATLQGAQILPVCLPESQSAQLLPIYTGPRYATYLNDTRFSGIGIGNDDSWTVVILTIANSGTPTTPGSPAPTSPSTPGTVAPTSPSTPAPTSPNTPATPGTPATGSSNSSNGATTPGSGSSNPDSGANTVAAISPIMVLVISFFMLF